ncbi:hypothetical protein TTHERM_00865040 (macronuclear) [Tetrahymena thermophila SB210]|uniref:Uncharacterized protein n=1 Tax=Tetrahymena thermophila (strain SB210) TaxID=312017 RepID=Q24FF9_TETTS|nr:hypothetical protein TTHERM_00865040 [Tetrahymena thermophila SB210]EAS06499.2 hypothetical protein TTHERM_00865040 [Tetrahymena thermophila SB210]|eukprot:XP_001026744.2 hypothetical protein TTHERM_00865040 [Tetrahymena thermophila SB210]
MITKLSENAIQNLLEKKEDTSIIQLLSEPKQFLNQESLMQIEISDGYFYYKKVFIIGNAIPKHNKLKKFMILKVNLNKQQQKQDMIIIDDFSIIYQNLDMLIGAPINFKKFQEGIQNPKGSRVIPIQYLKCDTQKAEQVKLLNPKTLFSESDSSQEKQDQLQNKIENDQNQYQQNGDKLQNIISQQKSQDSQSKFNYLGEDQDFQFSFDAFINKAKFFKQTKQISYNKSSLSNTINQHNNDKPLEKESSLIKNQGLSFNHKKNIDLLNSDKVQSSQQKVENIQLSAQSDSKNQQKQVIVQSNQDQCLKNDDTPQQNSNSLIKQQNNYSLIKEQNNNNLVKEQNNNNLLKEQKNINEISIQKQQDIPSKMQPVSKEINNIIQKNQDNGINGSKQIQDQDNTINSQQQNKQLKQNTNEQSQEPTKQNISAFTNLKMKLQQIQQKNKVNKEDIPIEQYLSNSQNQKVKDDQYFCMNSTQNYQSAQILKDQVQLSGEKYNRVEQKSEQIRKLFISKTSNKLLKKFKSPSPQKNDQGNEKQQNCNMGQFDIKKSIPIKKQQKSNQSEQSNMAVESSNEDEAIKNTKNNQFIDSIQFSQLQTNQKSINQDNQQIIPNQVQNKISNDLKKSEQNKSNISNVANNQSNELIKEKNQFKKSAEKEQTIENQQICKINQISNLQNQKNLELNNLQKSLFNQFTPIQIQKQSTNFIGNDADFLFSQSSGCQSQEFTGFIKASDIYQVSEENQNKLQSSQEIVKKQLSSEFSRNISDKNDKKEDKDSQQSKKTSKILEKEQNKIERDWKYLIEAIEDDSQSEDEVTNQYQENQPLKQKQILENTPQKQQEESSTNIVTQNINKNYSDNLIQNLYQTSEQKENIQNENKQDIINQQNDPSNKNNNQIRNEQISLEENQYLVGQQTQIEIKSQDKIQNNQDSNNQPQEEVQQSQYEEVNQQNNSYQEKQDQEHLNELVKFENIIQTPKKDSINKQEQTQMQIESQQISNNQDYNNENVEKQQSNNVFDVQTQENIKQINSNQQSQDLDQIQFQPNEDLNICDIEQQQNINNIQIQSQKSLQTEQITANNKQNNSTIDLEEEEEDQFDIDIDIESSQKETHNLQQVLNYQASQQLNPKNIINNEIQYKDQTLQKQNSNVDLMQDDEELGSKYQELPKIIEQIDIKNEDYQIEKTSISQEQISNKKDQQQSKISEQINIKNNDSQVEKISNQLSPEHISKKMQTQNNQLTKSEEKEKQKTLFDFNFKKDQQISQQQLSNIDQNQKQSNQNSNQKQISINQSKQTIIKKKFKIPFKKEPVPNSQPSTQKQDKFLEFTPQKVQNEQNQSSKAEQKDENAKKQLKTTPIIIEISDDEEIFQYNSNKTNKSTESNINTKNKQINNQQNKQTLSETKTDRQSIDQCKQSIQKQNSVQSNESIDRKSQSNSQTDSQKRKRRRLLKSDFEDIILKQLHKDQDNEIILQCPSINSSQVKSQQLPSSQLEYQYCFMKQFEYSNKDKNSQNLQNQKNVKNSSSEIIKIEQKSQNEDWECYSDISLNEEFIEIIDD